MPKISDEKRAARRAQILNAAWACFQRQGLHATTMDDIIRASGLSAGAVYSYYPSKEELILAAVTTSLTGLSELLGPILQAEPLPAPPELVGRITNAIAVFSQREQYDLKRIALLGWSESQRNEQLRRAMRDFYLTFRAQLEGAVTGWCNSGTLPPNVDRRKVAKSLLALILGFVVQSAITGDVEPDDIASGLRALAAVDFTIPASP
jgi:AcrR family transcriptional regulator